MEGRKTGQKWERQMEERKTGQKWESRFPSPKIELPCKSAAASRRASRRAIAAGDPPAPSLKECRQREARFSLSFPKIGLPCKSAAASAAHRAIAAGEPFGKPSPLLARECQQLADTALQTGQPLVPFSRGGPVACPLPLLERPFCCFPAPPGPLAKACAPLRCGRRPSRAARRRRRWRVARSEQRAWKRPPDGQGGCMGAEFASSRRLRWPRPPAVALPRSLPARRRFRSRGRPLLNPRSRLRDLGRLWVQRATIFAGFKLSTRKRGLQLERREPFFSLEADSLAPSALPFGSAKIMKRPTSRSRSGSRK
jgi:hypothetical protein